MPITYEIDTARDLVVYHASGNVTPKDALSVMDRAVTETNGAAMHQDVLFLLDPRASVNEIDVRAIEQIKTRLEDLVSKYPRASVKCAIVSTPPEDLVGELWRATTDAYPDIAASTRVFRTVSEAYAWLRPAA